METQRKEVKGKRQYVSETAKEIEAQGFKHELRVAWELGVTHMGLAEYRKGFLREGYHWRYLNSCVYYTPDGEKEARKIKGNLEVDVPKEDNYRKPSWTGPKSSEPMREGLLEVAYPPRNPRMLVCRDHLGRRVSVRHVRDARVKFKKGMKLDIEKQLRVRHDIHYPDNQRVYDFVGRYPRAYGRW